MLLDVAHLCWGDLAVDVRGQQLLQPCVSSVSQEADQWKFAFIVSDGIWRAKVPCVALVGHGRGPGRD